MAELVWDNVGQRRYQYGIDRGVLYLQSGVAIAWNGLTGMDEETDSELSSFYLDGVKFLENLSPGEFSGKLKAFTYPDAFDPLVGTVDVAPGLEFHEQPPQSFNLSYRTRIGDDTDSDAGYKIHLLYNILAKPESGEFKTVSDDPDLAEFSWSLSGTPPLIGGLRPTVHITIDSLKANAEVLAEIEKVLYGTADSPARLPSIVELKTLFNALGALIVLDNGDGTWTAIDLSNDYITMDSATEFTITGANATFLDASTYELSSTNP